jgi:hypothetical protein
MKINRQQAVVDYNIKHPTLCGFIAVWYNKENQKGRHFTHEVSALLVLSEKSFARRQ